MKFELYYKRIIPVAELRKDARLQVNQAGDGSSWNDGYYAVKWRDTLKNGRLQKLEGRPCAYGNREHGKVAGSNLSASVCWLPLAVFGNVL